MLSGYPYSRLICAVLHGGREATEGVTLIHNMRTHIRFEIPQVLEIAGLPIVNSDISFSPLELNRQCRISHAYLYLAIVWGMGN